MFFRRMSLLIGAVVASVFLPAATQAASLSYSATVRGSAPLGYWRMDEARGTSMTDASGHRRTGTYIGGVTHRLGGALSNDTDTASGFDGLTSAGKVALNLSSTPVVSVEFWLNWAAYAGDDRLALEFGNTFQSVPGFLIDPNSSTAPGKFEIALGDGQGNTYNNVFFAQPSAGSWHHYVVVFNRAADGSSAITPYVDQVPVAYTKTASGTQAGNFASNTLYVMSRAGTSLRGRGAMDELAVYPTMLSANQVSSHYAAAGRPAPPASPTPPTPPTPPAPAPQTVATFSPTQIPSSGAELPNSMRGEYLWYGDPLDPTGWPYQDSYSRFDWKQIEPTQNNYDFSKIDKELANAKARGGRFGFRIMAACTGCYSGGASVPDYLVNGSGQWVADSGSSFYIPDWNSDLYLSRVEALMTALGNRYRNDKRLGWIDMTGYGNWGEWHDWPYSDNPLLTNASAQRVINANVNSFPRQAIVMLTAHHWALQYALNLSPRIGLRVDCLGANGMAGAIENLNAVPMSLDRWKTAPVITEWCGYGPGSGLFEAGNQQVQQYHVSMLSSGNYVQTGGGISGYSATEQAAFTAANKASGYRLVLDGLSLPGQLTAGGSFSVTSRWENANVAPAYQALNVMVQLRNGAGQVAWQAPSSIDLRKVLPTNGTPVAQTDSFTLPALPAGSYTVAVQVIDPDAVNNPLNLAIAGRQADGSYTLGSVSVG